MRRRLANQAGNANAHANAIDVEGEISSEGELYDEIDSDDADSDDFYEPESIIGVETGELSAQRDFIGFT